LERRLKEGRLQGPACIEDIDFRATARPGQASGSSADPRLGLDPAPSTYFPGGPDRDRENVPGASLRAEGMSRWVHGLLRHCRTVVPELELARADGSYAKKLRVLGQVDALIVDDWAMAPLTTPSAGRFWKSATSDT